MAVSRFPAMGRPGCRLPEPAVSRMCLNQIDLLAERKRRATSDTRAGPRTSTPAAFGKALRITGGHGGLGVAGPAPGAPSVLVLPKIISASQRILAPHNLL